MPPKFNQKESIDDLKIKQTLLEGKVEELQRTVTHLTDELQSLHILHQETVAGHAHVERVLETVLEENQKLAQREEANARKLEMLEQYSRKYTLILTGRAVPTFQKDEDIRRVTLRLLNEYLGITLTRESITACHRLHSKGTILLRLADLDERMKIYMKRTKPIRHGLLVFESLTSERMGVIKMLKSMRAASTCPFHSYFTFRGVVFLKVRDTDKPIEVDIGTTEDQIVKICRGERPEKPKRTGPAPSAERGTDGWHVVRGRKKPHRRPTPPPNNRILSPLTLARSRTSSDPVRTSGDHSVRGKEGNEVRVLGAAGSAQTLHPSGPDGANQSSQFERSPVSTSISGDDTQAQNLTEIESDLGHCNQSIVNTMPKRVE